MPRFATPNRFLSPGWLAGGEQVHPFCTSKIQMVWLKYVGQWQGQTQTFLKTGFIIHGRRTMGKLILQTGYRNPIHTRSLAQINVDIRRKKSPILPPKQPFLSLFTYISPSGKRSAFQLSPIELLLEPNLCRFQPNGAQYAVFRKYIAPFFAN